MPDSGRQCHSVPDKAPVLEHFHLRADPHGGTRLGRAHDDATKHPEGAAYGRSMYCAVVESQKLLRTFTVRTTSNGLMYQYSGSSVRFGEVAVQTRGCAASERRQPCIGCPESAARDSCPRSRQSTRSAHRVTQTTSSAQPCAVVLKEHENAVLPAPVQIAQTQSSCATPTANTQC